MNAMPPSADLQSDFNLSVPANTRLFISAHAPPGEAKHAIGKPHYSYAFATEGHMSALANLGLPLSYLPNSDKVTAPSWGQYFAAEGERCIHLMFRNFRSLRPVKWARNIAMVFWEFDQIFGEEAAAHNPFRDQVRMLKTCDEVWVASRHTQKVFKNAGVENVQFVPSPVSIAQIDNEAARQDAVRRLLRLPSITLAEGLGRRSASEKPLALGFQPAIQSPGRGPVFFAMCNPLDPRKQLSELVQGFTRYWQDNPGAVLILKLSADPGRFPTSKMTTSFLPSRVLKTERYLRCPNIIVINSFMEDPELAALHDLADFFISPTRGEGQNLPLQEAMLAGTPVIGPDHTSMGDYLEEGAFIPLNYRIAQVPLGIKPHYHAEGRVSWYESTPMDIHAALVEATGMSAKQRKAIGAAGQKIIKTRYSAEEIARHIAERLSATDKC